MKSNWKNVLFCSILLFGTACNDQQNSGSNASAPKVMERPPEAVPVGSVQTLYPETSRRFISKVTAVDDVTLIARVSGTIVEQTFNNGDEIKKDVPLFIIENTPYIAARDAAKAKLAQSKATLAQAEAELIFAQSNLRRQEELRNKKATADASYDEAVRLEAACRAAVAAANASVSAAEASLVDAENNLSYTKVVSKISGKTGRATVSPGNYVKPGDKLVNVVSQNEMYVNFWISMNDFLNMFGGSFDNMRENGIFNIYLANGSKFTGKSEVVFLDNRVDKETDTIHVRLKVYMPDKKEDLKLYPDSLVSVNVAVKGKRQKPAVPVSAIMTNGNVNYVYVIGQDNMALIRPVVLIGNSQGNMQLVEDWVQIDKDTQLGLRAGEKVVIDGTNKVIPNRKVAPVEKQ